MNINIRKGDDKMSDFDLTSNQLVQPIADLFKCDANIQINNTDVSNTNPVPINNNYIAVTFQDAATPTGDGTPFVVGAYKILTVEIYGTSTTRTVTFYGKSKSGTLRALKGLNLSTWNSATSTTGSGEIWQFDITGLDYVIMNLTAVSGGNVSIKGNAIS